MAINFNSTPYYDDFDPTKNFHRILFKPGYAVQGRELTQSQTILQNQISEFASAIYSQNTPVSGGQVTTNLNCYYIKLNQTNPNGLTVTAANFANQVITDPTGVVVARVIGTVETTSVGTTVGDPPTLIVSYVSGQQFTDGMTLTTSTLAIPQSATVATSSTSTGPSTGLSSTASIANGVFYIVNGYSVSPTTGQEYSIGNFVNVNPQTIVLDKYDNTPTYRIGLQINETVYDYVDDSSLLDPAIGSTNFQAPGADRYVITLTLTTLPLTLGNDQGFIELVRIVNGQIQNQVNGTSYSSIDDYFAKRDYETNGDYIVNDFTLTPSANALGVSSEYDLGISKGIAYVHGYRIESQSGTTLTIPRAQSINVINNNDVYASYGNYFVVDTIGGLFDVGQVPQIDLHVVAAPSIATGSTNGYNSTKAGTAFIRNLECVSGTGSNTKSYVYNAFVSDFVGSTLSGTATNSSTANTIVVTDTAATFSNVANAYYGATITTTNSGSAVSDTLVITNYTVSGTTKTFYTSGFQITPTTSTSFTLSFGTQSVDSLVVPNGSGGYTANANINIASGKNLGIATNPTLFNNPGESELIFPVGYTYVSNVSSSTYFTQRVYRSKVLNSPFTLDATDGVGSSSPFRFEGSSTLSGGSAETIFIVTDSASGNVLDFTTSGNTIAISSDKTTATFTSNTWTGKTVNIIAQVSINNADTSTYVLKSKHLVGGNTAYGSSSMTSIGSTGTSVDLTNAQALINKANVASGTKMCIYCTDIKNIVKVYDTGSSACTASGTVLSTLTDITNFYSLDNGQRDNYYDFGSVSLVPGAPLPSGNILIVFNYYSHTKDTSGDGYFSVQSYANTGSTFGGVSTAGEAYQQIPVYTAKDGNVYPLRDCLDFRPVRANPGQSNFSATSYTWEFSNKQAPGTTNISILLPQNNTNFQSNYGYYLGRQDRLVLTKDKSFQVISGTPSVSPILPTQPDGTLLLANLLHDPYTGYVPGETPPGVTPNLSINKILHKRWAKSDITDLETRINNLEYYTSLSQLEAAASSTQVPDSLGVTRPNLGILVDAFNSYSTADTGNADYAANINVRKNQLTPISIVNNYQLQNPVVLSSLGTLTETNTYTINTINGTNSTVYTLPYTTANLAVQQYATGAVSVNPFAVVIQQGVAQITPPMDNWVDNTQAPPILVTDPSMQVYQQTNGVNLTNSGDFQTIPGTATTVSSSVSVVNHGNPAVNSPFGPVVGYTATTTSTYASQIQNVTGTSYQPVSSTFGQNNGYLTNIAVLPYIRPQQLIIQASGLLTNQNVTTWFDGTQVDQYMQAPNTIEVTGVSGTFSTGDIVGFYLSNTFYPIARVISVYNYPNGTQSRLYVADLITPMNSVGTTTIQNGTFDSNGNYISGSSTASGTIGSGIISISMTGEVAGVGGGYSNTFNSGATTHLYSIPPVSGYSSFLNQYGVWGDANNSTSFNPVYPGNIPAGTYTVTVASSGTGSVSFWSTTSPGTLLATVSAPSNSPSSVTTQSVTFNSTVLSIGYAATSSGTTQSAFAVTVTNSSGVVVFSSLTPPNLSGQYLNAGTEVDMYLGGSWFVGATQLYLGPQASSETNYYTGSKITITSKYLNAVNVAATYVPPPPQPSPGPNNPYGCVVATELAKQNNGWSKRDMLRLMSWSFKELDKSTTGKILHRGYQIVGPNFLLPIVKKRGTLGARYVKWSFNEATNMLRGKKFNPLSVLNTSAWIVVMAVTGLFAAIKESLYKKLEK